MNYKFLYFIQSNVFCTVLFAIILYIQNKHSKYNTSETLFLKRLIAFTMLYCFSDIIAWSFIGYQWTYTRAILYLANMTYIGLPLGIDFLWIDYVFYKTERPNYFRTTKGKLLAIPLILSIIGVISTPVTGFSFVIDKDLVYHRRVGAYITPLVTLVYLILATIVLVKFYRDDRYKMKRDEIMPLIVFPVPIVLTAILQVLIYGTTVNQLGLAISVVLVFVNIQFGKISFDELTGLNNRREFKQYLNGVFNSDKTDNIFICMIDVDYFKTINDTYGHLEGDVALKNVATLLKQACGLQKQRVFLARYGGDEFVIAGVNYTELELEKFAQSIQTAAREYNITSDKPYKITLSVGYMLGTPKELGSFEALIRGADEKMYDVKKKRVKI